jgi:ABC-2 type transport system ATP-binding protein
MIRIEHLTKRYRTLTALDGLSFEVGPGRVTGFLRPNGAGKTTTLRMLLGLAAADSGTAALNGLDPDGIRWMRDLLRHLAGEGRTVLVSSHLLAEAAQTVVVIITRGHLATAQGPVADLAAATSTTCIRTPDTARLRRLPGRPRVS